mmetsp:Transcript_19387/g.39420  ORF Transcript_19387/g.39420 Transcript_19387/m.39420 type:complete len:234 (+) Transcript_19387:49-750(+)
MRHRCLVKDRPTADKAARSRCYRRGRKSPGSWFQGRTTSASNVVGVTSSFQPAPPLKLGWNSIVFVSYHSHVATTALVELLHAMQPDREVLPVLGRTTAMRGVGTQPLVLCSVCVLLHLVARGAPVREHAVPPPDVALVRGHRRQRVAALPRPRRALALPLPVAGSVGPVHAVPLRQRPHALRVRDLRRDYNALLADAGRCASVLRRRQAGGRRWSFRRNCCTRRFNGHRALG